MIDEICEEIRLQKAEAVKWKARALRQRQALAEIASGGVCGCTVDHLVHLARAALGDTERGEAGDE